MTARRPPSSAGPTEAERPPGVLLVLTGSAGTTTPWGALVTAVAEVLGVDVAVEPTVPGDHSTPGWTDAVIRRAADAEGPVLVLPAATDADAVTRPERVLRRVLAPFDTSDEVSWSIGPLLQGLEAAGVEIDQLHVTSSASVPGMWEGSGHHAQAWRAELLRRHQVGSAAVEVTGGTPAVAVAARAGQADLVVLCWVGSTAGGRSRNVRAVLRAVEVPVLLLGRRSPGAPAET